MNKFAIFKLKEFFYNNNSIFNLQQIFSNEFEIKAEKVNFKKTENLIIAEGNKSLAFNNDGKKISSDKIIYFKNKI